MNSAKKILPLARVCTRQFTQPAPKSVNEVPSAQFYKLKDKQKHFQMDNGLPVYLKGGLMDKILFQLTVAGTVVGVIMGLQVFFKLAVK